MVADLQLSVAYYFYMLMIAFACKLDKIWHFNLFGGN